MYKLVKANNKYLSKWLPIDYPVQKKKVIEFYKQTRKDNNQCQYVITDRKTNEIMGACGVTKNQMNNNVSIGYWIGKEHQKNGYMTEAIQAVIAFCFLREKVIRIEINADEHNIPSQKVIERCGLKYEGTKRMAARNGFKQYGNLKMYSIIKQEWRK